MNNPDISLKHALTAVRKTTLIMAFFAAVFLLAAIRVHASDTVLTVQKDGETVKEFSMEELQQIASEEGDKTYSYSAWNTYPSYTAYENVHGPTITGILQSSGIASDDICETWTITFTDKEQGGYEASLTGKQLLEDRYYYPNGELVNHIKGIITEEAYRGFVKVPVIVSTESENENRLFVGQVAPNEENHPLYVKNLSSHGYIKVSTSEAPKCKPVTSSLENLTAWRPGKEITLNSQNNYEYDKIYYTFDENISPDYGCLIYNCAPKQVKELKPVLPSDTKRAVLKVVVKGYGKQDSDIQRFTYIIGEPLTVKVDGNTVKTYDRDELDAIAVIGADSGGLDYSGYNSYPTLLLKHIDSGYRLDSIIEDATGKAPSEFDNDITISFSGSDGYSSVFTMKQLFGTERFYYPNAEKGTDTKGGMAKAEAYKDGKPVPAVIDKSRESQLLFGQIAPNEQNHSEFVSYLLQLGTIEISSMPAEKCDPVPEPYPSDGSIVEKGDPIDFPIPEEYKNRRDKLYYIIDPSEDEIPGSGCAFYYYGPFHWPEDKTNPPVFSTPGHHTIAARMTAYGKQDSDVRVFDFYVKPSVLTGMKGVSASYNSVKLTWKAQSGISGYRIYRANPGKTLVKYKDISSAQASFTDKGLTCGTTYKYAVAALTEGREEPLVGIRSGTISVKPVPGKPTISLTAGSKRVKVKWSKVSGASGYVILRSTKKASGYKTVKTIKKGSVVSFTNSKLVKGRMYYYKVRAYRLVNGKRIYGAYSAVKGTRAK